LKRLRDENEESSVHTFFGAQFSNVKKVKISRRFAMSSMSVSSTPRPVAMAKPRGLPADVLVTPSTETATDWGRTPTPLAKSYFRRVRFRPEVDVSAAQEDQAARFPWIYLTRDQKGALAALAADIADGHGRTRLEALAHLAGEGGGEYLPAEVFCQRPDTVSATVEVFAFSPECGERISAANALTRLSRRLRARLKLSEAGLIGQHQEEVSLNDSDDVCTEVVHLKDRAVSPADLALVLVGASASALGCPDATREALVASASMMDEALALMAAFDTDAHSFAQKEMLRDLAADLARALSRAKGDRLRELVIADCLDKFVLQALPKDFIAATVGHVGRDLVSDPTLFMSHPRLHANILKWAESQRDVWRRLLALLRDASKAAAFLRGETSVEGGRAALRLWPLHLSPKCMKQVSAILVEEVISDEDKGQLALSMLASADLSCRTEGFLAVHAHVRHCVGAARLVSRDRLSFENVRFLLDAEELMDLVVEEAIAESAGQHAGQACREVLLYFMKLDRATIGKSEATATWTRLLRVMPALECLVGRGTSLGCAVAELLSDSRTAQGRLQPLEILRANMRLFFSKSAEARRLAQVRSALADFLS